MRIAVISDVHANLHALRAVLNDIERHKVDAVWCLGDMIGRGYEPVRCARMLIRLYRAQSPVHQQAWLVGNHEKRLLNPNSGLLGMNTTTGADNVNMIRMILDHRERLFGNDGTDNPDIKTWLQSLPTYREPLFGHVYLAHGFYGLSDDGLVDTENTYEAYPFDDANITDMLGRLLDLRGMTHGLVMTGHTHISRLLVWNTETRRAENITPHHGAHGHDFDLTRQLVYVNVGSVGFPRARPPYDDLCPTYVLLQSDDDTFNHVHLTYQRVEYKTPESDIPKWYPKAYQNELLRCGKNTLD